MSRRRGVTLPEIMLVVFLLGVLTTLGLQATRGARGNEQALAHELAAQIRAARQRAISRHMPCALVFPSNPSQSVSSLEGQVFARLVRTQNWQREYPKSRLQMVTGALDPEIHSWLGQSYGQLPCLVFTRSGYPQGARRIEVVGEASWILNVGPEGRVDVSKARQPLVPLAGEVRPALRLEARENRIPRVVSIQHSPQVHPTMLRAGGQAVVPHGGSLTLTVKAEDVDGDQLFVQWVSEEGRFSCAQEQPMHFEDGYWVAQCQYRPHRFQVGDRQILRCQVRDEHGALAREDGTRHQLVVDTGLAGKFGFWAHPENDPEGDLGFWVSSPEGHRMRRILPKVGDYAALSPDGEKVTYGDAGEGVWVANADGSDPERLFPAAFRNASFSPNGNFLAAFRMVNSRPREMVIARANGNEVMRVDLPPRAFPLAIWDANNRHVYVQFRTTGNELDEFAMEPGGRFGGRRREITRVRRFLARPGAEASDHIDFDWPQEVGNVLLPDNQEGRVRGSDPNGIMYAFLAGPPEVSRVIRQWTRGGLYRTPIVSSPYQGKTLMMEGWVRTDEGEIDRGIAGQERFQGYSLWVKDEEQQRRLLLPGVIARPCVPSWSR